MMKRKLILIFLVVAVAVVAAILYFRKEKNSGTVALITEKAQYGYIGKSITATGTLQPVDTVSVGAQVSGVVSKVYVDFNDVVKKGQLLAKIDPSIITAQMEQAVSGLTSSKSNLQFQQSNFIRQKQLLSSGVISNSEYEIALNQYNSSKAAVESAAAQLSLAKKNLSYTNIYSPIDGVVLNRNVSAGQTIASNFNAPTLFVIAKDLTKMQVRAAVDEADIGGVGKGQKVNFTVDAFPDDIFAGNIQDILLHPSIASNVVTYTTLVNVDNKEMKLKPGMTASINIYIEEDSNALLIPSKALNFRPDSTLFNGYIISRIRNTKNLSKKENGTLHKVSPENKSEENPAGLQSYVWIKKGDTLAEKRILTGVNDDTYAKVIKGILPGEEVVVSMAKGGSNKNTVQRSPFMPQMQRRPAGGRTN